MQQSQLNNPSDSHHKKYRLGPLFWIVLLVMGYLLFSQTNQGPQRTQITYTKFKDFVRQGKIDSVTVQGNAIRGEFTASYLVVTGGDTTSFDHFQSRKPDFEDEGLIPLLEENNVQMNVQAQESSWLRNVLILLAPWLLLFGLFYFAQRRMRNQTKGMMGRGGLFGGMTKSKAKKYKKSDVEVTFNDVAGLENPKKDLQEIIDYLKDPEKYMKLGADIPRGVLMVGPPGTGKTLLARAVAGEAKAPFFSISGSEFIEMFVGVGASRVRDMFKTAKKESPAIIFIDEIDSVGRSRGTGVGGGHDEREQTLNQILNEMDGFDRHESVIVIAATNMPDVLDAALTRPGRFDRQITLERPHKKARKRILEIHTRDIPLHSDVDLENLAARTVGFSGADLKNLANEAALLAGRDDKKRVSAKYFDRARDKILLGYEREEILDEEERKHIAYHESGHALMAKLLPTADPIQKVTIIPRGRSLGATEQRPEENRHNLGKKYLQDRIKVMLGGRVAEKITFQEYSNGAADDLQKVTKLARYMISQWGMSDEIGPVTFKQGDEHLFLGRDIQQPREFSEYMARKIDEEIVAMVKSLEEETQEMLKKHEKKLHTIAEALLDKETLSNGDIEDLLK